jgi:predicted PurR-regulated permease PerM
LIAASSVLVNKAPEFISKSIDQLGDWVNIFSVNMPQTIVSQLESMFAGFGPAAGKFIQDFVVGSMAIIPSSMPTIIGFITLPFFLFFILFDYESFGKYFYEFLSPNTARRTVDILNIIGNVMGRYIRSQIILGLIVGFLVFIGLFILKIDYAPALGAVTAVTQFIPIVGPFISGLIIIVITLAMHPDKVLWALLVIVLSQIILNTVFLNWIQGKYMQIHPAIVMVLLVVGGYIGGFWGMILALPVAATVWEIFKYFRNTKQAEKIAA